MSTFQIGSTVRVMAEVVSRRAMVSFVEDDTIDVIYDDDTEETVPTSQVRELESFEASVSGRSRVEGLQAFVVDGCDLKELLAADLAAGLAVVKDRGNVLYKLKDFAAASEYFSIGLDYIDFSRIDTSIALARRKTQMIPVKVMCENRSTADEPVHIQLLLKEDAALVEAPLASLLPVCASMEQRKLQIQLYQNRARAYLQLEKHQLSGQDLSICVGLAQAGVALDTAENAYFVEALCKSYYLRARARLLRRKFDGAAQDCTAGLAVPPPDSMLKAFKGLEREVEVARRAKVVSDKRFAREIAKFCDQAFSQMASLETADGI